MDLPDTNELAFKQPSIWQYAHKAGFKTVLIDAFAEVMNTHSFMMKTERVQIDRMIPIDDVPVYLRDQTIAARVLPDLLGAKERQFIYVNKKGIHRPYHEKYPQDFGGPGGVLPTAVSLADLGNRDPLLKTYQRAVQWSVDEFFRTLLPTSTFRIR